MKKFLIAFGAVVSLVGFAVVNSSMAAQEIKVFSGKDATKSQASYYIALENYNPTTPGQISAPKIICQISVDKAGPIKAQIGMANGTIDATTSGKQYVLGAWVKGIADGVVGTGDLNIVVNNDGTKPIVGLLSSGKLTFNGPATFGTGFATGLGSNVTLSASIPATVTMFICMIEDDDTATQFALDVQATTFASNAVATGIGKIGFSYTPDSGLSSSDAIAVQYFENSDTTGSTAATVASFANQYLGGVKSSTDADGIIDVNNSRTQFTANTQQDDVVVSIVDLNSGETVTDDPYFKATSRQGLYHNATTNGNGSVDDIYIDLIGSNQAISTVKDGSTTLTYDTANGRWRTTSDVSNTEATTTFTITTDGSSVINTRSFTASISGKAKSGFATINHLTAAAAGSWSLNGYQAIIPFIDTRSTVPTYCVLSNADTIDATIFFDVLASEGTISGLQGLTLGTLAAGKSALLTLSGETVTLAGNTAVAVATGTDTRYSGRVVATANINNVHMDCVQVDPVTGAKRKVNVLTEDYNHDDTSGQRWHQ